MKTYTITAEDSKFYVLTKEAQTLGQLRYSSWFSFNAAITLSNGTSFEVVPKGFWGTTIEVKQVEQVLADFRMNWKGEILIHTQFDGKDEYYIFKRKGLLKSEFLLLASNNDVLLHFNPDFTWKKLNYDYRVTTEEKFEALNYQELLLLIAAHGANYYMTMMAAAAS